MDQNDEPEPSWTKTPYVWLQDTEEMAASDDGHLLLAHMADHSSVAVFISPVLQAAPELLEAATALLAATSARTRTGDNGLLWRDLRAAIAKAEGRDA